MSQQKLQRVEVIALRRSGQISQADAARIRGVGSWQAGDYVHRSDIIAAAMRRPLFPGVHKPALPPPITYR